MASTIPAAYLGTTTAGTVPADWDAGRRPSCRIRERSTRMNIAPLDWVVLVAYLVVITGDRPRSPAIASARAATTFSAAGEFGPWLMVGQSFGVGTHAEMPVALAGAVYSLGASAHLVSVEEPLRHALLLDHGAGLPPDPADDDGGVHRGSVRLVDGRHLHRLRAVLLHHQHRQHAQGRRQSDQPGDRRRPSA